MLIRYYTICYEMLIRQVKHKHVCCNVFEMHKLVSPCNHKFGFVWVQPTTSQSFRKKNRTEDCIIPP